MKVGIFSTHILWPTHYETDLEIIQKHIHSGDLVYHFTCDKKITCCELKLDAEGFKMPAKQSFNSKTCNQCIKKRKAGQSLLTGKFIELPIISEKHLKGANTIDEYYFQSHKNLKELCIDDYEVGWSILSTIISYTRNPFIRLNDYAHVIQGLYNNCYSIYKNTLEKIDELGLEVGYVFNGRFSYTKAILKAFDKRNKICYTHERGSSLTKYSLFKNQTIHNILNTTELIRKTWEEELDVQKKEIVSRQFFIDRAAGKMESWKSFTEQQNKSLLPVEWNENEYNVVVFTSSEDEFVSIGPEWDNPIYNNQIDGLFALSATINTLGSNDLRIYIRVHPNTINMDQEYHRRLTELSGEKVIVIPADSEISTYAMMQKADKIVSFGSTIGIEAVYWNKVSILLGKSLYYYLSGLYKPADHNEAVKMILDRDLQFIEKNEARQYGYFFKSHGVSFQYYEPYDYKSGKYRGINLEHMQYHSKKAQLLSRMMKKIKKYQKIWYQ